MSVVNVAAAGVAGFGFAEADAVEVARLLRKDMLGGPCIGPINVRFRRGFAEVLPHKTRSYDRGAYGPRLLPDLSPFYHLYFAMLAISCRFVSVERLVVPWMQRNRTV